jgi:hypothetical protein
MNNTEMAVVNSLLRYGYVSIHSADKRRVRVIQQLLIDNLVTLGSTVGHTTIYSACLRRYKSANNKI